MNSESKIPFLFVFLELHVRETQNFNVPDMGLEIIGTLMFSITSLITKLLGVIFDFLVYVITFGKHKFRSSSKVAAVKTDSATKAEEVFEKELPEIFAKDKNKDLFDRGDKTRVVVPTFRFFPIETKDTIGKRLFGERVDSFAMSIIRGGMKHNRLRGMSLLSLVGIVGLGLSWAASLKAMPEEFVLFGMLSMPNCIVYYIVLNRVIVRKLLKNFTFWYLLFNISASS